MGAAGSEGGRDLAVGAPWGLGVGGRVWGERLHTLQGLRASARAKVPCAWWRLEHALANEIRPLSGFALGLRWVCGPVKQ